MEPPFLLLLLPLLLSSSAAAAAKTTPSLPPTPPPTHSPSPSTSSSSLDPKQLQALQSLNTPLPKNPCTPSHSNNSATLLLLCDAASPFRHVTSLSLSSCPSSLSLSFTALKSLSSSLLSLHLLHCPAATSSSPLHLPPLSLLTSFSAVSSLRRLSGVFLSRLTNLTDLTVVDVPVTASAPYVILGNLHKLTSVVISNANLTGNLPRHFRNNANLTRIDLSINNLKGSIPASLTALENLRTLNLSLNALNGSIPTSFGDLISLVNVSLANNALSGEIPDSISAIPGLTVLDLSSNGLNGSVPRFLSEMRHLTHLDLANNRFSGVVPFNASFISRLQVFKIGGNANLCYNHTVLSSKMKLGIAPCDKHGMPMSPPPAKEDSGGGSSGDDSSDLDNDDSDGDGSSGSSHHHGPNKVVLGVAIALASLVFLIIFLILCAKWCG